MLYFFYNEWFWSAADENALPTKKVVRMQQKLTLILATNLPCCVAVVAINRDDSIMCIVQLHEMENNCVRFFGVFLTFIRVYLLMVWIRF